MVYTPSMLWLDTGENTLRWSPPGVTTGQEDTWSPTVRKWNTPRHAIAAPALTRHVDGVYMAWVGSDGYIRWSKLGNDPTGDHHSMDWSSAQLTGYRTRQRPALASYAGHLFLAWKDADEGTIHWVRRSAGGWEAPAATPWPTDHGPALGSSLFGGLFMAWRGKSTDSQLHWTQFNSTTQWFDGPEHRFDGWTADSPALAGGLGLVYMVWRGNRTATFDDKRLWWSRYDGGWSAQQPLDGWSATAPSLAADGLSISLVYTEQNPQDGHGQLYWSHVTHPGGWAPHQAVPGRKAYFAPAIA